MDKGGPYNLTLLPVQVNEIRGEHPEPAIHSDVSAHVMFAHPLTRMLSILKSWEGDFDLAGLFRLRSGQGYVIYTGV